MFAGSRHSRDADCRGSRHLTRRGLPRITPLTRRGLPRITPPHETRTAADYATHGTRSAADHAPRKTNSQLPAWELEVDPFGSWSFWELTPVCNVRTIRENPRLVKPEGIRANPRPVVLERSAKIRVPVFPAPKICDSIGHELLRTLRRAAVRSGPRASRAAEGAEGTAPHRPAIVRGAGSGPGGGPGSRDSPPRVGGRRLRNRALTTSACRRPQMQS